MHTAKILTSIIVIAALIIGLSAFSTHIFAKDAHSLEQKISSVESSTRSNDWESAQVGVSQILEEWPAVEDRWSLLLDHSEIDAIADILTRTDEYIKSNNSALALAELATLKKRITGIPDKEAFKLTNIF